MSSQMKKRFEELQTYLSKDAEGQKKLKAYKDAVNELRTDLAAEKARSARAEQLKVEARERADRIDIEAQKLIEESRNLRQYTTRLEQELADAKKIIESLSTPDEEDEEEDFNLTINAKECKAAAKALRKVSPDCPRPVAFMLADGEKTPVFNRESLAEGWGHTSLWTLGASVALLAAFGGIVVITTEVLTSSLAGEEAPELGPAKPIFKWLEKNIACLTSTRFKSNAVTKENGQPRSMNLFT